MSSFRYQPPAARPFDMGAPWWMLNQIAGGSIHSARTLSPRIPHTTICLWVAWTTCLFVRRPLCDEYFAVRGFELAPQIQIRRFELPEQRLIIRTECPWARGTFPGGIGEQQRRMRCFAGRQRSGSLSRKHAISLTISDSGRLMVPIGRSFSSG